MVVNAVSLFPLVMILDVLRADTVIRGALGASSGAFCLSSPWGAVTRVMEKAVAGAPPAPLLCVTCAEPYNAHAPALSAA